MKAILEKPANVTIAGKVVSPLNLVPLLDGFDSKSIRKIIAMFEEQSPTVQKALFAAAYAHHGQIRKGSSSPYFIHPLTVYKILEKYPYLIEEKTLVVALLHDILEDVPKKRYSGWDIWDDFGRKELDMVMKVSEDKYEDDGYTRLPWKQRKNEMLERIGKAKDDQIVLVYAADKLANMRDTIRNIRRAKRHGGNTEEEKKVAVAQFWGKFNSTGKQQLKHYVAIGELLKDRASLWCPEQKEGKHSDLCDPHTICFECPYGEMECFISEYWRAVEQFKKCI